MSQRRTERRAAELAKLTRPRLHAAIPRERLFRMLDALRPHRSVVWIVGPPGAGKSTLAATWLEARRAPSLWYQLDAGDSDPATFFFYLRRAVEAVDRGAARKGTALPLLGPEYRGDVPRFARRWFRDALLRLPPGTVLALDNYQELPGDSALHRVLAVACAELPEDAQVLVVSRTEPPAELAGLLASERLGRIDPEALKLTPEEADRIGAAREGLEPALVRELHAESGGWAAGFTLLRERLRRTGLVSRVEQRGSMQEVFDYFMAEVFRDASEETRDALLRLAFLPRFTEAMAAALTGNPVIGELLDDLYRRHLFLDRRYGATVTYELHMLFRAFLRDRAERGGRTGAAELSRRAAAVLEQGGLAEDAVEVLMHAGEHREIARIVERLAPGLVAAGRGPALEGWCAELPAEERDRHPWLSYWLGAGALGTRTRDARAAFERAYGAFVRDGDRVGQVMAVVGVLKTHLLDMDDLNRTAPWLQIAVDLFAAHPSFPTLDEEARALGTIVAIALWEAPGLSLLPAAVARLEALLEQPLHPEAKVTAASELAEYYGRAGWVEEAERIAAALEPLVRSPAVSPFTRATWYLRASRHHHLAGDLRTMRRKLDESLAISLEHGFHVLTHLVYGLRADLELDLGDLDGAAETLASKRAAPPGGSQTLGRLHWIAAKLAALRDDLDGALRESEAASAVPRERGCTSALFAYELTRVSILAARGELAAARTLAEEMRRLFPAAQFPHHVFLAEAAALVVDAAEDAPGWPARLRACVEGVRALGVRVLGATQPLLARDLGPLALAAGVDAAYVREWIRALGLRAPRADVPGWPWAVRIRTLGEVRIEVDDRPLTFAGKAPRRPLELLEALVGSGTRVAQAEAICGTLWPDSDGDNAAAALRVTLARLRRLLGASDAVLLQDGKLSLSDRVCWVDAWALERLCADLDAAPDPAQAPRLLELYRGPFLAGERDAPWVLAPRERLRRRFEAAVARVADALERRGAEDAAAALRREAAARGGASAPGRAPGALRGS